MPTEKIEGLEEAVLEIIGDALQTEAKTLKIDFVEDRDVLAKLIGIRTGDGRKVRVLAKIKEGSQVQVVTAIDVNKDAVGPIAPRKTGEHFVLLTTT